MNVKNNKLTTKEEQIAHLKETRERYAFIEGLNTKKLEIKDKILEFMSNNNTLLPSTGKPAFTGKQEYHDLVLEMSRLDHSYYKYEDEVKAVQTQQQLDSLDEQIANLEKEVKTTKVVKVDGKSK